MILTLSKLGLLMLSYLGYWEFFRSRCRMNVHFVPAFTLAVQFSLMFLPGLLNFLPEAVWLMYLGGFVLLAEGVWRKKAFPYRHYLNWGYALMVLALAAMAMVFRGKVVTWFDNFTHWAVAVKSMLAADRFPTFAQEAITFNTYPLGSSGLIYYFCRFTSQEEDFWMLAQGFVMLCMLLPLFAWEKKKTGLSPVFLALAANLLLCYNTPLTELLVDTLLPLAGTALLLFLHRECLREEDPLPVYYGFPFLFWVMNIKNAGILYVIAGMVILLLSMKRQNQPLKQLWLIALALLAGYLLWDRHCDYVFYQNAFSQHEISMEYFNAHLSEKSLNDILNITYLVMESMVLRMELLWILGALAVLGTAAWRSQSDRKKEYGKLVLFLLISWLIYWITLVTMYVSSMSLEAALQLQSADRYIRIWEITAMFLMAVFAADMVRTAKKERLAAWLLTAGMFLFWLGDCGHLQFFANLGAYDPAKRLQCEAPIAEYGVQPGYSYLICADDAVVEFPAFLWGYHLNSSKVHQIKVTEPSQMDVEKYYDYVVILEQNNPIIEQWVRDTYPEQAGQTVIQCFK